MCTGVFRLFGTNLLKNISSSFIYCTKCYVSISLNAGPQLSTLHLDSSLLLPPKAQPPLNTTSLAQPTSSGLPQSLGPDGEQAPGASSSGNEVAASNQIGETPQGVTSDSKEPSSTTPPANTPTETPEL